MDEVEFCTVLRIDRTILETWIERRWLTPGLEDGRQVLRTVDVARGRLLLDLDRALGVNAEGMDVIIHVLDQFYGLRVTLGDLLAAINAQPEEVRRTILASLQANSDGDGDHEAGRASGRR